MTKRLEIKYRISDFDIAKFQQGLTLYLGEDEYTRKAIQGGYFVRSLYYDTYQYKYYQEKINGEHRKVKFRIRTYTDHPEHAETIRLEMKVREGASVEKFGYELDYEEYRDFVRNGKFKNEQNPVVKQFYAHFHRDSIRPVVLIDYERKVYESDNYDGLRISVDQNLRAVASESLFPGKGSFFREIRRNTSIIEIKTKKPPPLWLHELIRQNGFKWISCSKYAQGIQIARHDLYHPSGVVVIR